MVSISRGVLLSFALPAWACGGMSADDIGLCRKTSKPVSDGQVVERLGFSPNAVWAWVVGSREIDAQWGPKAPTPNGESNLKLSIERGPGVANVVDDCEGSKLELPALIELSTDDGLLEQTFDAPLATTRPGFATTNVQLDSKEFLASFGAVADLPQSRLLSIEFRLATTPDGIAGALQPLVERRDREGISDVVAPAILQWPAPPVCSAIAVPRESSDDDAEWLEPLRGALGRQWLGTRDGQAIQSVEINLDHRVCEYQDGKLSAPATIRLTFTETGMPLELLGEFERGENVARFKLASSTAWGGRPSDFEALYGNFGTDLSSFDHVAIEAEITVGDHGSEGSVIVAGFADACGPCDGPMCPSCGASDETRLMEIVLHPL